MKTFDPHGWTYLTRRPIDVALDPALEHLTDHQRLHLNAVLVRFGGKAFGLRLCEQIAMHSEHLSVPPWMGIQISEIMYQDLGLVIGCIPWLGQDDTVILRSSAHEEDWMSADSGVLMSPVMPRCNLRSNLIDSLSNRIPQVIQKHTPGLGIVMDICWSKLLNQPIVRIASGREYQADKIRRFSSATSDHEGLIVILDLDGNILLEPQRGDVLVDKPVHLPHTLMARELVGSVSKSVGTQFGVQLELVVHPDTPDKWSLVQLRPTPGRVRVCDEFPDRESRACTARTAAVSGSFYHKGRARILTPSEQRWLMSAEMSWDFDAKKTLETGVSKFNDVSIVVWEKPPHPDFGIYQMRMLHRLGAIGQISCNAMTMNTSHGKVQRWIDSVAKAKQNLVHSCALLGIRKRQHKRLLRMLRDGPQTLEIISDGLIGEVHLIDTSDL